MPFQRPDNEFVSIARFKIFGTDTSPGSSDITLSLLRVRAIGQSIVLTVALYINREAPSPRAISLSKKLLVYGIERLLVPTHFDSDMMT